MLWTVSYGPSLENFDALQLRSNLHATSTVSDHELLVESLLVTE